MSSTSNNDTAAADTLWIVYDGECPLCSRFAMLYRVRELVHRVCLVDARSSDPVVDEVRARGFDLDAGMVVKLGGRYFHGADAMNVMAMLGSDRTLFNRLNRAIFRYPRIAHRLYPILAAGRRTLLLLLGRKLIGPT